MSPGDILWLAGIAGTTSVLMTPVFIVRQVLKHREKLAAIKNKVDGSPALAADLAALRRELADLRETSTRFDMSFDAALSQVENRLRDVETKNTNPSGAAVYATPPTAYETNETVSLRR